MPYASTEFTIQKLLGAGFVPNFIVAGLEARPVDITSRLVSSRLVARTAFFNLSRQ
jgi:hypothetical protein